MIDEELPRRDIRSYKYWRSVAPCAFTQNTVSNPSADKENPRIFTVFYLPCSAY
jgi:hypothetical protein